MRERFAAYAKYPPLGERSWGSYGGLGASGLDPNSYLREANRFSLSFAMIETREAMAIVDDILALEGIDALFVGPSDLSIALSGGKQLSPAPRGRRGDPPYHRARLGREQAGRALCRDGGTGEGLRRDGRELVTVMSDSGLLRTATQAALKVIRG